MHISGKWLVYGLIGATLTAGAVTSAVVRPGSQLAASADCYGLCRSMATLSLSPSAVFYGHEQAVKFRVKVGAGSPGTGVPTGRVVVKTQSKVLCTIRLRRGAGTCSPAARALRPGRYMVVASYGGNKNFKPSTSKPENLRVLRNRRFGGTVTEVRSSRSAVFYGHEQAVKFRVRVSADSPGMGVPTGNVIVESATKTLCTIRLRRGAGTCSPAARALRPGRYMVVAKYGGNKNFKPSTSKPENLLVLRNRRFGGTVTEVRMSRSAVFYGHEQAEKFSVTVSADSPGMGVPTGNVVVDLGTKTLCTVHLSRGAGTCSPTARALVPGRYRITAHYGGNKNFKPSTPRGELLFVVRR